MNSTQLQLQFCGQFSTAAVDQIADLLLQSSTRCDCELCQAAPAEHLVEHGQWEGKYVCSTCCPTTEYEI